MYILVLPIATGVLLAWLYLKQTDSDEVQPTQTESPATQDGASNGFNGRESAAQLDDKDTNSLRRDAADKFPAESPRSIFGAPIVDPYGNYERYIADATAGDAVAQYELSSVLFECKGLPTQLELDSYRLSGLIPEEMGAETQARLDVCTELIDKIGKEEISNWNAWLSKSAVQGFPLALGRDMIFSPGKYDLEQAGKIVTALVRVPEDEKFALIASYFANFKEDDRIGYEAWMRLSCQTIPDCHIQEYVGEGHEPLRPNELEQVKKLVSRIELAIEQHAWEEIKF